MPVTVAPPCLLDSKNDDVMEDELMSLQRKIADLESKLNYSNPNESQQHPVNGGSGESGEIKI